MTDERPFDTLEATTFQPPSSRARDATEATLGLYVLSAPAEETGSFHPVGSAVLAIGRQPGGSGLTLRDRKASRVHAYVTWDATRGDVYLRDAGSTNGTFVGGRRTDTTRLVPGDVVRIGDTVFRVGRYLAGDIGWRPPAASPLRGGSAPLKRVLEEIHHVAHSDLSVLVVGETGTGKELVAREIHRYSGREGAFVPVNCAALPDALVEGELFGHRKGAFSGATSDSAGLVRSAAGGTLFLDEVGELALPVQAKLLRVLEERRVRPVGGTQEVPVDVRFVFATNRDLRQRTARAEFREDLFARINQWELRLPPLRERPEDIVPIAEAVLERHAEGASFRLTGELVEALVLHDWPHNVRELVAVVRRAMVRRPGGGTLDCEHLPPDWSIPDGNLPSALAAAPSPATAMASPATPPPPAKNAPPLSGPPTREELEELLRVHDGNVSDLARSAGRSRMQVYRWIRAHGLEPGDHRRDGDEDAE